MAAQTDQYDFPIERRYFFIVIPSQIISTFPLCRAGSRDAFRQVRARLGGQRSAESANCCWKGSWKKASGGTKRSCNYLSKKMSMIRSIKGRVLKEAEREEDEELKTGRFGSSFPVRFNRSFLIGGTWTWPPN